MLNSSINDAEISVEYRVVNFDKLSAALWILLAVLHLTINNIRYYIPLDLLIVVITLGIVLGAVSFGLAAVRTLKIIEKKGVFSQSISEFLFIIGIAVILIGALFFVYASFPFQSAIYLLDFLYPMPPAAIMTRVLLYWRWERKNKRLIYASSGFSGKVYAYPYIINTQNQLNTA